VRAPLLIVAALLALAALAVTAYLLTAVSLDDTDGVTVIAGAETPDDSTGRARGRDTSRDVAGSVTDRHDNPIPNATVAAGGRSVRTDAEGRFLFEGLDRRVRELLVRAEGRRTQTLAVGRRDAYVTTRMHDARHLPVSLVLPGGLSAAGARLIVRGAQRRDLGEFIVGEDGTLPPLELTTEKITIEFPAQRLGGTPFQRRYASVRPGRGRATVFLEPEVGAVIAGIVLDPSDDPVENATVQCKRYEGGTRPIRDEDTTGPDGRFELILDPGATTGLRTITQSADRVSGFRFATRTVTAEAGAMGVRIRLEKGLTTTGRLLLPDGTPARRIRITVHRNWRRAGGGTDEVATGAQTDNDGAFHVGGLIRGHYWVMLPKDIGDANGWILRDEFEAGDDDVELQIADALAIAGRLLDEHGEPIRTMNLLFRGVVDHLDLRSRTNAEGRFIVQHAPPGEYHAAAIVPGRKGWVDVGRVQAGDRSVELRVQPAR